MLANGNFVKEKIVFLTDSINSDIFPAMTLILEISASKMHVKRIIRSSRIYGNVSPSLINVVAIVSPMIKESRTISIRERLIGLLIRLVGETENVVASYGISIQCERM